MSRCALIFPVSRRRDELRGLFTASRQFVFGAAVVGTLTGFAVAGFERVTVNLVFEDVVSKLPLALLAFAPAVGLAIATLWLRGPGHGLNRMTADEYLDAFHGDRQLLPRDLLNKLVAAVATLGLGGAMGLEGPSIYMGASIGASGQRRFTRFFGGADRNLLLVAGAAAGIAAIFKAPATGAIFAIEVPYQNDLARRMLLPALVAAASGYLALVAVNGSDALFPVHGAPALSFVDLAGAAGLGLVAAFGARLFAWMLRWAKRVAERGHVVVRVATAGGAIALLFAICRALTGESLVLTPGYGVVTWALDPKRSVGILLAVLVLRCLATTATVSGGGVGGLFVPLVVAGALLGRAFGIVVGGDESLFLVVGVAAFLGAGYRVPLAAVMFVAETTGRPGFVVPALIAAVVAELVMGNSSITTHQKVSTPGLASNDDGAQADP
jgi:CIC family chloride channel protein